MARPALRRRSNDGSPVPIKATKLRGSATSIETDRTPLVAFGPTDQHAPGHPKRHVPPHRATNFEIFVDQRKRKRPSAERREAGLARARFAGSGPSSPDDSVDASGSESDSSPDEDARDDAHYLHSAQLAELRRLDKAKLIELACTATGRSQRALDAFTKTALVDAIVEKRAGSSRSHAPRAAVDSNIVTRRRAHGRAMSLPSIGALSISDRSPPRQQRNLRFNRSISDNTPSTSLEPLVVPRVTRLRTRSSQGSAPSSTESRHVAFDEQILEERSNASEDEDEDEDDARRRLREPTPVAHRTRRRSSKTTPANPSTARTTRGTRSSASSLESDDEDESVESNDSSDTYSEEADDSPRSHRRLRNGKMVVLAVDEANEASEGEAEEDSADDDDDDDDEDDDELVSNVSSDHGEETLSPKHLQRLRRDDLVKLCEERDLDNDGTRKELIDALVTWRETAEEDEDEEYAPSTSSVASSPMSFKTPRRETKTQALAAIETAYPSGLPRPPRLLADQPISIASSRPETPTPDSDEDIETLDLDSLGLTDKAIAPEKIKRGQKIGSGGFKDVYIGKYRNVKVAIADLRDRLTDNDIKELTVLRDLQHANIVRFIGVSVPDDPRTAGPACSLVTELCPNGDLYDYLRSGIEAPSQRTLLRMMLDITSGLEYLHTRPARIIHRDMKSSNVLITAKGVAKINDFGLARVKTSTRSVIKSLVGTVNWQAPELWAPKPKYNEKVDVYATGLVFWEMLQFHMPTKRYPFEGSNEHAIYHDVGQLGLRPPTATMGRKWGAEILDLVNRMWAQLPGDRPSMTEVREELQTLIAAL